MSTAVDDRARSTSPSRPPIRGLLGAAGGLAVVALVVYGLTAGTDRYVERGDPDPGRLVGVLDTAGYFVGFTLAGLVFGLLVYIVTSSRTDDDGYLDATVYPAHRLFTRVTPALAVTAWVMTVVAAADGAGLPLGRLLSTTYVFEAVGISEKAVAWLVVAVCATFLALIARFILSWTGHVLMLIPSIVAAVALPMAGNAGQGPDHDYNTGIAIFFALAVAASFGIRVGALTAPTLGDAAAQAVVDRRRHWLVATSDVVLALSSFALAAFLVPPRFLFTTAYGLAAVVALIAAVVAVIVSVRAVRTRTDRHVEIGTLAALTVLACWAVMDTRVAPGLLVHPFTGWDVFLGYELPGPPSVWNLATFWRFDFLFGVLTIAAGVAYAIGVRRLKARGDDWPVGRTVAWMTGCVLLVIVVSSGVRSYGSAMFSIHMAEHMALNMFIPVLLVLGAPATLALRVLPSAGAGAPPGPREWLLRMLHSKVTRVLSNPVVALVMFVLSLYIVYFSPIFGTFARYHWGHVLLTLHFLLVGYLFFWVIIGINPGPRRIPYLARIGLLFAVMPFHAFFGIALMTMSTVIGEKFYGQLSLPWVSDRLDDQWLGGAIAWGISEIPVLIVVVAIVAQWAKSDKRAGRRADRHAETYEDAELDDYNALLEELAKSRR